METLTPEQIAHFKNILKDLKVNSQNHSIIKDNKIFFMYNKNYYRCVMPNQRIESEAEEAENICKLSLIQKKGNLTKRQLIESLKENLNIDINELEDRKNKILNKLQDAYIDLANVNPDDKDDIEDKREIKNRIESELEDQIIEIAEYLSPCVESQSKVKYYRYLAYGCTEKLVSSDKSGEEKWEKAWLDIDSYNNDDTGLPIMALDSIQKLTISIKN